MFGLFFLFMMIFYVQANLIVNKIASQNIYSFPGIWYKLAYVTRIFAYILGVISITMITSEIRYKTLRQNIIDGMSRWEFLASKLLFMGVVAVITMVLLTVFGMIYGLKYTNEVTGDMILEKIYFIPATGLYVFGYMVLAFLVGLLIKRTGVAVVALILYLTILEPMLRFKLDVPYYLLPGWCMGSLLTIPTDAYFGTIETDVLIANVIMITILIGACYLVLKKRDL